MKNQDDIEPTGERDELHELLCAYVLGETDAAESARIEAELESNANLRAERDSLQATIGLVKRFTDRDATLPETAHAELAAKTGGGATIHKLPLYRRSSVRAAAGVLVAVGAGFAVMSYLDPPLTVESEAPPSVERASAVGQDEDLAGKAGYFLASTDSETSLSPRGDLESGSYRGAGDTVPPGVGSGSDQKGLASADDALSFAARGGEQGGGTASSRGPEPSGSQRPLGTPPDAPDAVIIGRTGNTQLSQVDLNGFGASTGKPVFEPTSPKSGFELSVDSKTAKRREVVREIDAIGSLDPAPPVLSAPSQLDMELLESLGYTNGVGQESDFRRVSADSAWLLAESELLERLGLEDDAPARIDLLRGLGYLEDEFDGSVDDSRVVELRRQVVSAEAARQEVEELLGSCQRRPGESVDDMFFRHWGTHPIVDTADDPLSTFSIDVDTASYTLARGMLDRGILPKREQIRPEEFVNYFDAEVPAPTEDTFALATEMAPNPFGPDGSWLLRTVVKAKDVLDSERESLALVFVVDVSGSMKTDNRIGLVKDALGQLLTKLDGRDRIALVTFSKTANVVLPMTQADRRGQILAAIEGLGTGGGTNLESGLVGGYELAAREFDPELQNRVVLLSDGVGNIGETDQERLLNQVAEQRAKGLYLNTIGFGISNHNDAFLEQLANGGDGQCNYVDSPVEARKAFVENFTGAFQTVARDVKIQVEFNALQVGGYRLIGYENRAIADREFRQDSVDAGEVGAGQGVVAVYELFDVDLSGGDSSTLGTLRLRFKPPFSEGSDEASELEQPFGASGASFDYPSASSGFRKSTLVAQAADVLRKSWHATGDSVLMLATEVERLAYLTNDSEFREFAALFERNRAAIESSLKPTSDSQRILDELRLLRYELELEREAEGTPDPGQLESLEQRITEREAELREIYLANTTGSGR